MVAQMVNEALWLSGPAASLVLVVVLVAKGRVHAFPAFFTLIFLSFLSSVVLFGAETRLSGTLYREIYEGFEATYFVIQVWVLIEVVRVVLRPTGRWTDKARTWLSVCVVIGACLSGAVSFLLQPASVTGVDLAQIRLDMFLDLLTCEIIIGLMISASQFGLGWKNHVIAIAQGLIVSALVTAISTGIVLYAAPESWTRSVAYYLKAAVYAGTLVYWSVSLWHEEPVRKPISPALRKYIVALQDRVQYDLGKVGH